MAVRRLDAGLPLPSYARPGDAGLDLHSRVDVSIDPGERGAILITPEADDPVASLFEVRLRIACRLHGYTAESPGVVVGEEASGAKPGGAKAVSIAGLQHIAQRGQSWPLFRARANRH